MVSDVRRTVPRYTFTTVYIRCATGTSVLTIPSNEIEDFNMSAVTNAPYLSFDIAKMANTITFINSNANTVFGSITNLYNLQSISVTGTNTISGDVSNLTQLNAITVLGTSTISGDVSNIINLKSLRVKDGALTGSVSLLIKLEWLAITSGSGELTGGYNKYAEIKQIRDYRNFYWGDLSNLTLLTYVLISSNSLLSGSVTNLVKLTYFSNISTGNTITGDISNLVDITTFTCEG